MEADMSQISENSEIEGSELADIEYLANDNFEVNKKGQAKKKKTTMGNKV